MSRFDQLKKLEVSGTKTARLTLYALESEPVLILAPATESNKPYFNGLLKRNARHLNRIQSRTITVSVTKENRDDDRRLYAEHVVKGWESISDSQGNQVPFDKEACLEFLTALPDYIFDDVRVFATNPRNFTEEMVDPEEVSGN